MWNKDLLVDNFLDEEKLTKKAFREGFGDGLVDAARQNRKIVALSANLAGSLKLNKFMEEFPERFIEVGVAEQNMASIGSGMALYGKIPFITTFAAFSPGLNWKQIQIACASEANLKVASSHYGVNIGQDGMSAQMLEDIAMMRVIPNMTVLSPGDYWQAYKATKAAAEIKGPVYLRFTREAFPMVFRDDIKFQIGKADLLKEGSDATIIVTGSLLYESIKAAEILENENIKVDLINLATIKPLDEEAIVNSAKKTGLVVTVEEHQIAGGMGSAVTELLSEKQPTAVKRVGMQNSYGETGLGMELIKKYHMDRYSIVKKVREEIN